MVSAGKFLQNMMADEASCYPRLSAGAGLVGLQWQTNPLHATKDRKRRSACWERPAESLEAEAPASPKDEFWRLGFGEFVTAKVARKSCPGPQPLDGASDHPTRQERAASQRSMALSTSADEDEGDMMLRALLSGMAQSLKEASLLYREEEERPREHDVDDLDCGARVTTELRAVPKDLRAASLAFTAFAPKVFLSLRALRGCSSDDVRAALSAVDLSSGMRDGNGKSGAFFMFTPDRKYVVKTLTEAEKDFLLTMLPHYYRHMSSNPDTLLPWFLGMYRMKAKGAPSKPDHTLRVVVMANVFDGASETTRLDEQYDLKGSTHARTNSDPGSGPAKDLDWKMRERRMVLDRGVRLEFERQLKVDVSFLESMNVMDYSLLLGLSHRSQEDLASTPNSDPKEVGRSSAGLKDFFATLFKPEQPLPQTSCTACADLRAGQFRKHQGGIASAASASAEVYYCGIIDILQPFNLKKKIEMTVKGKVTAGGKDAVSCADPHFYGQRFLGFVLGDVLSESEALPPLPPKSKRYLCKARPE